MKVSRIMEMLNKLGPILEHYRDYTVDEMLDDIYQKCCKPAVTEVSAAVDAGPQAEVPKPAPGKLPPAEAALLLPDLNRDEQLRLLNDNEYKVIELKEIAKCLKLKLGKANKEEIKEIIVNQRRAEDKPHDVKGEKEGQNLGERVAAALEQIRMMQQEEIVAYLTPYYKHEIMEIGRRLNLRLTAGNRKDNIILLIAKHIGYKDVNRRISERPSRLISGR